MQRNQEDYYDNDANVGYPEGPTDLNIKNAVVGHLAIDSSDTVIRQDDDFNLDVTPSDFVGTNTTPDNVPYGVSQIKDSVAVNTILRSERTDIDVSGTKIRAKMPKPKPQQQSGRNRSNQDQTTYTARSGHNQAGSVHQVGGFSLANISGSSRINIDMDGLQMHLSADNLSQPVKGPSRRHVKEGDLVLDNTVAINTVVDSSDTKISLRNADIVID